jgi:FAD/FMN-containing dehydrogenase
VIANLDLRTGLEGTGSQVTAEPMGEAEGFRVFPPSVAALGRAVALVRAKGLHMHVRGNGDAPWAPPPGGVLLDLHQLDRIASVDGKTGIARAEAGCSVAALEAAARRAGSTLGPLLPSVAGAAAPLGARGLAGRVARGADPRRARHPGLAA